MAKKNKAASKTKNNELNFYTCSMHPEIRQQYPGECPICGMDLENSLSLEGNIEVDHYNNIKFRFILSCILTIPIVFLVFGEKIGYLNNLLSIKTSLWLQVIFATPVVFGCGGNFFKKGWGSLKKLKFNMFTLISIGAGVTWLYSLMMVLVPHLLPSNIKAEYKGTPVYFESSAIVITLVLLGQLLEAKAKKHTGGAIKALLNMAPEQAVIVDDGKEKIVRIDEVKIGDLLVVKSGEKIPVDGEVYQGFAHVDESMITGESRLVKKEKGDKLIGGTINENGNITMLALHVGKDGTLSRIAMMINEAQHGHARIRRFADSVSSWFVIMVVAVAILTFCIWYVWGPSPSYLYAIMAAASVLIIACPCALGLAAPISIMVGVDKCAQNGILVESPEELENLEKLDVLIVDKTGTLTAGIPNVVDIIIPSGMRRKEIMAFAASIEACSSHPLSNAFVEKAKEMNIDLIPVADFKEIAGKGVSGVINDKKIFIGNMKFIEEIGVKDLTIAEHVDKLCSKGVTVVYIAMDEELKAVIAIEDPIKPSAKSWIKVLSNLGIKLVMLTGDNAKTAEIVANRLGIKNVFAEVTPEQKGEVVEEMKKQGKCVAMVGDGINDAIALAKADVGIAMGSGADVAMESAGLTLLRGDLKGIIDAYNLSKLIMRNIRQNIFFALAYNVICIPVAAGILYPVYGVLLNPIMAAVAMSMSSVSVILNALLLKKQRINHF